MNKDLVIETLLFRAMISDFTAKTPLEAVITEYYELGVDKEVIEKIWPEALEHLQYVANMPN